MQNFTLVINDNFMSGSHCHTITRIERIKTNDLPKVVKDFDGAVCYVFLGHPELEREFNDESDPDWLTVKTYKY